VRLTLDEIRAALDARLAGDPNAIGWRIAERVDASAQRLYRDDEGTLIPHQTRTVRDRTLRLTIWVRVGERMGAGDLALDLFHPLADQIAQCIAIAASSDNHPWTLPEPPDQPYPEVETADSGILEDPSMAADRLEARLNAAIDREQGVRFNSAELYVSGSTRRQVTHTGIDFVHTATEIVTDLAVEPLPGPNLQEVHDGLEGVGERDIDIETFVAAAANEARLLGDTQEPKSSEDVPILIGTHALAQLFTALAACLSAQRAFLRLGSLGVGESLHTGERRGDAVGMTLDPFIDRMVRSRRATSAGQIPRRARVIDESLVLEQCIDHRYGQYLGVRPNHVGGNVVVDPGTHSIAALRARAPHAIQVLSFSGLLVDRTRLTWSSEIKLGRQRDQQGRERWLRGGVVSGDFRVNLSHMFLSSELGLVNEPERLGIPALGYRGPAAMLIVSGMSVVGEGR